MVFQKYRFSKHGTKQKRPFKRMAFINDVNHTYFETTALPL